jgi:hypothetical protein
MYKYLDAWRSTVPVIQGSQVVKLLTDMRDQGIIKTEQEFRTALNTLTGAINANDPVPLSKLFPALLDTYIDSESFNWMIDRITSDLVSGFSEAQNIEDLLLAHRKVYEEFSLAKLKQIIGTVEEKVVFYELLKQNEEGFSNIQYNTFTQNARSTSRSSVLAQQLFQDKSSGESLSSEYDAVIDAVNESLELPATVNTQLFVSAQEGAETTETDHTLNFPEAEIRNVIDGTPNTFYIKTFLMEDIEALGAQLKIELNAGTLRALNYKEIYPIADYPFQITDIQYVDENNVTYSVELQDANLLGVDIHRPTRFHFTEITAQHLHITALQPHYTLINFQGSSVKETPSENFEGTYLETQAVQDIIRDGMEESAFLAYLRDLFAQKDLPFRVYQYLIGFDNIWVGRLEYGDVGIFVGEAFKISRCRRIGLIADEDHTTDVLENQRASIEYWIYKQDYNSVGGLIGYTHLPIMHEGESESYERLHLKERTGGSIKVNTGTLRFQGHWGVEDPDTVFVYVNGLPLEQDVDWTFTDSGEFSLITYTRITITDPQLGEVYTVRYTPVQYLAETTKHYQRNQPYGYYFGASNVLRTAGEIGSEDVDQSDVYLIVIIRHNNNIDSSQSPRVNEYSLMVASQDPNKLYE